MVRSRRRRSSHVTRLALRRRERYVFFVSLGAAFAFFFIALLSYLSYQPGLQIRYVAVSGNRFVSPDALVSEAASVLRGSYGGVFSRRNALIAPVRELASRITSSFPAVESVSVKRGSFSVLDIDVSERVPYAVWCSGGAPPAAATSSGCDFLDARGLLFAPSPAFSPGVYLRFTGSSSTSTAPSIGRVLLGSERFTELSYFLTSLKPLGIAPDRIAIEPDGGGIVDLDLFLPDGAQILMSTTRSFEDTLNDMVAFFDRANLGTSTQEFLDGVQYVDFRFPGKVYYKPK